MLVDVDNGCISFFPHLNFSKICYLNYQLKYMNLDYIGFTKSDKKASFVYFNDSGTIDPVLNMGVILNYQNGSLRVQSAEITHFSRYGFIRKED